MDNVCLHPCNKKVLLQGLPKTLEQVAARCALGEVT